MLVFVGVKAEADYQIRKAAARLDRVAERRKLLLERASAAAAVLRSEFGAGRVWLFGSLRWPWFHEESDLDLAAEGIDPARIGQAWDRISELVGQPVDLVSLDEAPDTLRRRILESGEVLA